MLWDVYCRVVDNLGDAGVCWRLAADLAAGGERVRLVIDDPSPLNFMAPDGAAGVTLCPWSPAIAAEPTDPAPADVVIEAFGCNLPASTIQDIDRRMRAGNPPVWINLEYLSAESWVDRAHGLPSPQRSGAAKWFYFPGFSAATGGLLREPGLTRRRRHFRRLPWLAGLGIEPRPGERIVSLFCYDNAALPALLRDLSSAPTLLLLTADASARATSAVAAAGATASDGRLRVQLLPWLSQTDFDHLLWSCDLNLVRGEDSLVRAIWAGAPFIWQAYPQGDGAHRHKVEALIARLQLPAAVARLWRAWNGMLPLADWPGIPPLQPWRGAAADASAVLQREPSLSAQLCDFVHRSRRTGAGVVADA